MITGFQTVLALSAWVVLVLLHALWRGLHGPEADAIRPTGPIE